MLLFVSSWAVYLRPLIDQKIVVSLDTLILHILQIGINTKTFIKSKIKSFDKKEKHLLPRC